MKAFLFFKLQQQGKMGTSVACLSASWSAEQKLRQEHKNAWRKTWFIYDLREAVKGK